jgi:hypothetical protein
MWIIKYQQILLRQRQFQKKKYLKSTNIMMNSSKISKQVSIRNPEMSLSMKLQSKTLCLNFYNKNNIQYQWNLPNLHYLQQKLKPQSYKKRKIFHLHLLRHLLLFLRWQIVFNIYDYISDICLMSYLDTDIKVINEK